MLSIGADSGLGALIDSEGIGGVGCDFTDPFELRGFLSRLSLASTLARASPLANGDEAFHRPALKLEYISIPRRKKLPVRITKTNLKASVESENP
ncbi:MAG: hypothetical protein ACKOPS_13565 [Cyanobium sp.]